MNRILIDKLISELSEQVKAQVKAEERVKRTVKKLKWRTRWKHLEDDTYFLRQGCMTEVLAELDKEEKLMRSEAIKEGWRRRKASLSTKAFKLKRVKNV